MGAPLPFTAGGKPLLLTELFLPASPLYAAGSAEIA
ncbi:chorismate pyruvate lyase [Serratia plymuthica]|uniref:Chorismate pyruvate lyase n=1 Tax=Serratia plymuthica TaxID=82996 RepID=A0A2X4V499_SERPL|nr:chorismate pyruvate lyase [Serratia plymuthica]